MGRFRFLGKWRGAEPGVPASNGHAERVGLRVALYSHDTQGLGHIRRNLLISRALCRNGSQPVILLLSGLREAAAFAMPAGVDCLTLPSFGKDLEGRYYPRSLGVSTSDLVDVRTKAIQATVRSFDPDVLIVDKVPKGVFDELLPTLEWLKERGRARIVLGLREILDERTAVRDEWARGGYEAALRSFYSRIWIYGDPRVYDAVREYRLPKHIAEMVRFTGYLNPLDVEDVTPTPAIATGNGSARQPATLCLVGGGRDGLPLAEAFLRADLPGDGVLVTGPLMPDEGRATLRRLAAGRPNVTIHEFITDPCPLLAQADRVIAMGGYNTMCEVLAFGRPALVVPRVQPRTEQLIRARRLARLGLVTMVHPDQLNPAALSEWLLHTPAKRPSTKGTIDFDGVRRLPELLDELVQVRRAGPQEHTHAAR